MIIHRFVCQQFQRFSFIRSSSTLSTIFALATGPHVRSGVAIIRVSGSSATQSLLSLTKEQNLNRFKPNHFYLTKLYHRKSNDLIDQCMCVWFKGKIRFQIDSFIFLRLILFVGPKSFTGEDVVE